jgi:ketosteroid isomerase-like protein
LDALARPEGVLTQALLAMLGRYSPAGLNPGFGDNGHGLAIRNSGEDTMAQDNRLDPARLERIERRLQLLEDAEAIRNLKARYAALCDNQYDAEGIANLFTEDAVWESARLGRFEGREAIRSFFRGASAIFSFAIHYSLNGHIEVEGDTARARWYLFMPCTLAAGNQAVWRAGIDHETYARLNGTWMFRHKRSEPLMSVPFETGWARTRFA